MHDQWEILLRDEAPVLPRGFFVPGGLRLNVDTDRNSRGLPLRARYQLGNQRQALGPSAREIGRLSYELVLS